MLSMGKGEIAITLDAEFIGELDRLVEENYFQNLSHDMFNKITKEIMDQDQPDSYPVRGANRESHWQGVSGRVESNCRRAE
jgi:hypothetical protein